MLRIRVQCEAFDTGAETDALTAGRTDIAEIQDAYQLLTPMLGVGVASTLFAVALLASGQNSTITGTLAGQIVMEGFLNIRLPFWIRRLITRLIAIVPAAIVAGLYGGCTVSRKILYVQALPAVLALIALHIH